MKRSPNNRYSISFADQVSIHEECEIVGGLTVYTLC